VASSADRNEQLLLARKIQRLDHIVRDGAPSDQGGLSVDRHVEYLACCVVLLIARNDQLATKTRFQLMEGGRSDHRGPSFTRRFISRTPAHAV